jgi:hypothetical protein
MSRRGTQSKRPPRLTQARQVVQSRQARKRVFQCRGVRLEESPKDNNIGPRRIERRRRASPKSPELSEDSRGPVPLRSRGKCAVCADRTRAKAGRYSSLSEDSGSARSFVSISSGSDSSIMGTAILYFPMAQLPRSRSRQRALQKGNSAVASESTGSLQMGHLSFTEEFHVCRDLSSTGFSLWGLVPARSNPHRLKPVLLKPKSSVPRLLTRAARARSPMGTPPLAAGHPVFPLRGQPCRTRASL